MKHFGDAQVHTAADGFRDLLADTPTEMAEDLLLPIVNWSDFWPKRFAVEIVGLPEDEEYEWEELLDGFESRERRGRPGPSEPTNWRKAGF
jgi:hypothetical protein